MPDTLLEKIPKSLVRNMVLDTIAAQNDFFRKMVFMDERLGSWVITSGIEARGPDFCLACIKAVRNHDTFTPETDPYGERAMGSFEIGGEVVWWNIHLYNQTDNSETSQAGASRPAKRVLTILFPSEIGGQKPPVGVVSPPNRNAR